VSEEKMFKREPAAEQPATQLVSVIEDVVKEVVVQVELELL